MTDLKERLNQHVDQYLSDMRAGLRVPSLMVYFQVPGTPDERTAGLNPDSGIPDNVLWALLATMFFEIKATAVITVALAKIVVSDPSKETPAQQKASAWKREFISSWQPYDSIAGIIEMPNTPPYTVVWPIALGTGNSVAKGPAVILDADSTNSPLTIALNGIAKAERKRPSDDPFAGFDAEQPKGRIQ